MDLMQLLLLFMMLYGKEPYATSNVDLAKKYGYPMPTKLHAILVLFPKRVVRKIKRVLGL